MAQLSTHDFRKETCLKIGGPAFLGLPVELVRFQFIFPWVFQLKETSFNSFPLLFQLKAASFNSCPLVSQLKDPSFNSFLVVSRLKEEQPSVVSFNAS